MSSRVVVSDAGLSHGVGIRFVSLIVPVTITMLAVVWSLSCLSPIYVNNQAPPLPVVVNENDASSVGEKFVYSLLAALIVVGCVVAATFAIVVLYHFHLQFVLYGWLAFSAVSMFFLLLWIWLDLFCTYYQIPYNVISMGIFVWNFGVVGLISLFYYTHPTVTQVYLVIASILTAWSLTALPEWSTWALLICIAVYDILAVLWQQGPLHRLIKIAQERDEPIPGFIYSSAHSIAPIKQPAKEMPAEVHARAAESFMWTVQHAAPFKLGLGDFIFYSLLVGRASFSGFVSWGFCMVSILAGMLGTLLSLLLFRNSLRALPALPLSIFLSVVVFVLCRLFVESLSSFTSHRLLVL
ncbi:presenilin-like aspartic peptidase, putative [Leishmania tarentolae]|uniref:Presenilin n=1 Tax=Leishmania tarentolae TaxID=5689 RepID=A0A640KDH6_LEITA|nr:presenilin-like aspartic peptidase, putative [Leishmania tarentolae]